MTCVGLRALSNVGQLSCAWTASRGKIAHQLLVWLLVFTPLLGLWSNALPWVWAITSTLSRLPTLYMLYRRRLAVAANRIMLYLYLAAQAPVICLIWILAARSTIIVRFFSVMRHQFLIC